MSQWSHNELSSLGQLTHCVQISTGPYRWWTMSFVWASAVGIFLLLHEHIFVLKFLVHPHTDTVLNVFFCRRITIDQRSYYIPSRWNNVGVIFLFWHQCVKICASLEHTKSQKFTEKKMWRWDKKTNRISVFRRKSSHLLTFYLHKTLQSIDHHLSLVNL